MSAKLRSRASGRPLLAALSFALAIAAGQAKAFAQASSAAPTAHDLAARVDRHYNQLHSLRAGFTETYQGLGMDRTESGTLLLLKPGNMRWDYTTPPGKIFLVDSSYSLFYAPGDAQVQRIRTRALDDMRSPLRLLLGHTKLEKELENLTVTAGANGRLTLTGVPKGLEKRVARIKLTVTTEGAIESIEIAETDGALTRFVFTGEEPNASIPAGVFRFTPPAGIPVVDALPPA
jgi:outer membrane lipoprotein carrier protein